jgi:hypothetical protein
MASMTLFAIRRTAACLGDVSQRCARLPGFLLFLGCSLVHGAPNVASPALPVKRRGEGCGNAITERKVKSEDPRTGRSAARARRRESPDQGPPRGGARPPQCFVAEIRSRRRND